MGCTKKDGGPDVARELQFATPRPDVKHPERSLAHGKHSPPTNTAQATRAEPLSCVTPCAVPSTDHISFKPHLDCVRQVM